MFQRVVTVTQAEYENLNTVAKTLVPASAGNILLPVFCYVQVQVTLGYGGNTVLAVRNALGSPSFVIAQTPNVTAIATVSVFMPGTGAVFSTAAPPVPVGSPLVLTGNAALGGGTIAKCRATIGYVLISGNGMAS